MVRSRRSENTYSRDVILTLRVIALVSSDVLHAGARLCFMRFAPAVLPEHTHGIPHTDHNITIMPCLVRSEL